MFFLYKIYNIWIFSARFARLPYNSLAFDYVKHLLFKILTCSPQLHYNALGFEYVNNDYTLWMYWVCTYKWITLVYFNMIWSICFVSGVFQVWHYITKYFLSSEIPFWYKKHRFVVVRIFVITSRYLKAYQRHTWRHIRVRPSYLYLNGL